MNKADSREWVASLEQFIDIKLRKWIKENPADNGSLVERRWTFEQNHIHLKVFWEDGKETVQLFYISKRGKRDELFHGLDNATFNDVGDLIGDLEHITMFPPRKLYGTNG